MLHRKRTLIAIALMTAGLAWVPVIPAQAAEDKAVVNINTADAEALMLLPRVGPSVAQRIVEFREKNGRFKNTEDLMLVRGIGEKTFQLIQPHIVVSGETTLGEKVSVPKEKSGNP